MAVTERAIDEKGRSCPQRGGDGLVFGSRSISSTTYWAQLEIPLL
jgi:hypothetical protein